MANSSNGRRPIDPLVSSQFMVIIDGIAVARFASVDGLSVEVEMIEYRDSTAPNLPRYRQGRAKPCRVTLKRGLLVKNGADNDFETSNRLLNWIEEYRQGTISARNVVISVGSSEERHGGKADWMLYQCRPTKWSLGSLEGSSNTPLFETLELAVEEVHQA